MSADFTPEKEDYKILTPFKMQVLTNFPYIEADFDALTNYQLLCKVVEYLNNVITNENEVTEQVTSLYNAYVSLQNYVNEKVSYMEDYLDNLDVQEEINNKLDKMSEDGSLTNLIKDYVDPIYQAYENEINLIVSEQTSKINTIENKVNSATSGSPSGVYSTVSDLTTADPDHDKIYIVSADGYWYYYNTSTSLWTAGGLYQAAEDSDEVVQLRKDVDTIVEDLNTLYDLVNDITFTDGKYISYSTGGMLNLATWSASDYIPVEGNIDYIFDAQNNVQGAFYDSTKTYISDSGIRIEPNNDAFTREEITSPATAKYVRISGPTTKTSELHIHKKGTAIFNKDIEIPQIDSKVNPIVNNINSLYDLVDHNDLTSGGYIIHNGGGIGVNADFSYTDFIEIDENKSYTLNYTGAIHAAYYGTNKRYISGLLIEVGNDVSGTETLEIPENTGYIRLSCLTAKSDNMILRESAQATLNELIGVKTSQLINDTNDPNIIQYTVLEVGTGKTYTTLRDAFAACVNPSSYNRYIVNFYGDGTEYDISTEFTNAELADASFIGRRVPKWTKLRGVGGKEKCIIGLRLSYENRSSIISTINTYGSSELEDLTIIGDYARYAVHDDYRDDNAIRVWKNCKFETIHAVYGSVVGAGTRSGDNWTFENCIFIANNQPTIRPFSCHNNIIFTEPACLTFINCRFINNETTENTSFVEFSSLNTNANGIINNAFFYGCQINNLQLNENNAASYGSGILWKVSGYGNNLKTSDVSIIHTDEHDYTGYVDLI